MSNKSIARLLEGTMYNASIMDDYDEVIGDHYDADPEGAEEYHEDVMAGLVFINKHLDKDYDVSRDGSGTSGMNSIHMIYVTTKESFD